METIIWFYAITSVLIVSLIALVGIFFLSLGSKRLKNLLLYLVGFAVGGLFGDAFIHLLPEAFKSMGGNPFLPLYILSGIFLFFMVEKVVRWRHCHIPCSEHHYHPIAAMSLIGDSIHNFIDGILIAATYSVSIPLGLATTLAVIFHEIPQEIGDFGVLLHAGLSAKKALLLNLLSASASLFGALFALLFASKINSFSELIVPIAAGGFIYIAGADLIPELQHDVNIKNSLRQLLAIFLGLVIMLLLARWF